MHRRNVFRGAAVVAAALLVACAARAGEPVKVVASFSILADMVRNVGGATVEVAALVGPDADAHVFEPSPAAARALAGADLVVVNGLGFEGWLDRLVGASGYAGPIVVASDGIVPLAAAGDDHDEADGDDEMHEHDEPHGAWDPHAWQSLANARRYVENIAAGLVAADPTNGDAYRANAAAYLAEIEALDAWVRQTLAALPESRRTLVTSHEALRYFATEYGLRLVAPVGMGTEAEASAAAVAALVRQLREHEVKAVFLENIANPRIAEQIAREAGAAVGGTLYTDALSQPGGPADTYLKMIRYNAAAIAAALR